MTDWRILGYVPDSDGDDEDESLVFTPISVTEDGGKQANKTQANGLETTEKRRPELDIYDLPASSIENKDSTSTPRGCGRGRPRRRGRGGKRLSTESSNRPKKQARIEEKGPDSPTEGSSTPVLNNGHGKSVQSLSPFSSSSAGRLLNFLDSSTTNDIEIVKSDTTLYSAILGEDYSVLPKNDFSDIRHLRSGADTRDETKHYEAIDLIDEHGPESQPDEGVNQFPVPPSSPPALPQPWQSNNSSLTNSPLSHGSTRNNLIEVVIPTPSKLGLGIATSSTGQPLSASTSDAPVLSDGDFTAGVIRNLRERKPIQMRPYLVEGLRYKDTMQSRGIRPVKVIQKDSEPPASKSAADDDSENPSLDDAEEPQSSNSTQSIEYVGGESQDADFSQDESIPVLDDHFERLMASRKSGPNPPSDSRHKATANTGPIPGAIPKQIKGRTSANASVIQKTFGRGNESPQQPQTPLAKRNNLHALFGLLDSSDVDISPRKTPKSTARRHVLFDSSDEEGEEKTPRNPPILVSSSSSSSSSDSGSANEVAEKEIERYQRKVRGVLPASYLRLSTTTSKDAGNIRNGQNKSPPKRPPVPGMAQMRIRSANSPPPGSVANPLNLSDEESSQENPSTTNDTPRASSTVSAGRAIERRTPSNLSRAYAFEDNSIDMMLSRPSAPRSGSGMRSKSSKGKKLKQSKLRSSSFTNVRNETFGFHGKRAKPKPRPPALSVVDACKRYRDTKATTPPQFMRVAERRAKTRKNNGRHLPDRKVINIGRFLEDDETDIEDTLTRWKRAKLKSSPSRDFETSAPEYAPEHAGFSGATKPPGSTYAPRDLIQTRLGYQSTNTHPPPDAKLKPRVKYKNHPQTPLAVINRRQPRRIEDIFGKLKQNVPNQSVGFPATESSIPSSTIFNQVSDDPIEIDPSQEGNEINKMPPQQNFPAKPQQYFVDAQRMVFGKNGKRVQPVARRSRKPKTPKQILENRPSRIFKPPENVPPKVEPIEVLSDDEEESSTLCFENMPSAGTQFSPNFGINLPRPKKFLDSTTFVASGEFLKCLETGSGRTLPRSSAVQPQTMFGNYLDWGIYSETVGAQFEKCISNILEEGRLVISEPSIDTEQNTLSSARLFLDLQRFLRFVANYLSNHIYFPDLIDISWFAIRFSDILANAVPKIAAMEVQDKNSESSRCLDIIKIAMYSLVSVTFHQIRCIVSTDVETLKKIKLQGRINDALDKLISTLFSFAKPKLESIFSRTEQPVILDGKFNGNFMALEGWIIAYRVAEATLFNFWEPINSNLAVGSFKLSKDIQLMESVWRSIFRLLPLSAISVKGDVVMLKERDVILDNWAFVKEALSRAMEIYNRSKSKEQTQVGTYIKALYGRCLILLRDWKWSKPESAIIKLYDFFARSAFHNLKREVDHGSPKFLQNLPSTRFETDSLDTCFSILLKFIAIGVRRTRLLSGDKAAGDLFIRLLPNHSRTFLMEDELLVKDLNTLRNHHNLLTVIYYGIGSSKKTRIIGILRSLVDPAKSHADVCSLSLRTWANVINFEISDEKSRSILGELMRWHSHVVQTTIELHKELKAKDDNAEKTISDRDELQKFKRNVESNKRSLEGILMSAVNLLRNVLDSPNCDFSVAQDLLASESMKKIFLMSLSLRTELIAEAVNIVSSHVRLCKSFLYASQPPGVSTQEESQDSWNGFDLAESVEMRKGAAHNLKDQIYEPLFELINNYFAAEKKHLDHVLIPCTKVWVELGDLLVGCGLKQWDDYFNSYSKNWFSMINSDTKKTFSVSYVNEIMKMDAAVLGSQRENIMEIWITSLVERDSMLKFQHELTTTLFNQDFSNILFSNMPFEVRENLGLYDISLRDFKERRLQLISTLLDNMQRETLRHPGSPKIKSEFIPMLNMLMQTMKQNYTEILSHQQSAKPKMNIREHMEDANLAQSSYVTFCQKVVELLQQYTADILRVDSFFTDSVAFPLPMGDPVYLISRLKRYAMKLWTEKGGVTQFYVFFHNTCARVAVDGEQSYFVDQMLAAFEEQGERDSRGAGKGTLRRLCLCAVFPSYIRWSMDGLATLLLAAPIIVTTRKILNGLIREVDTLEESRDMDNHIAEFLVVMLDSVRMAVENSFRALGEPLALFVLGLLVSVIEECDVLVKMLYPRSLHISDGISIAHDLLKIVVRELSRLKASLTFKPLPEKLDLVMMDMRLPLVEERRKFEDEYRLEMRSWKVEKGDIKLMKQTSRGKVSWRHLLPAHDNGAHEVEAGKLELVKRLDKMLGRVSLGVCERVVREVDEQVWDQARRPVVGMMRFLYDIGSNEDVGGSRRRIEVEGAFDEDE